MSIYKEIQIKSKVHNYKAQFTEDFCSSVRGIGAKKLFLFVDRKVANYFKDDLKKLFVKFPYMLVDALERNKTIDNAKTVIRYLIDHNIKKDYIFVALGGGIVQDIVGFVASIIYRGVEWVFCPSTLLAQSDSCIGSKTSINIDEYKNQVGNFYPPSGIFIDTRLLKTLSTEDVKSGLGEIIKVHLLDGRSSFRKLLNEYDYLINDPKVMREFIIRSLLIKKRFIEKDEFDVNYRNILNYGHTFGHALESVTEYKLPHGQAVTIGMDISNYISWKKKYIKENQYHEMRALLLKNWPSHNLSHIDLERFFLSLSKDKKNTNKEIKAILTKGPGKMIKEFLPVNARLRKQMCQYFLQDR